MMKSLTRKYRGQLLFELKQWFSFPTMLLVGGFAFLLYQLFFLVSTNWLIGIIGFIYLALSVGVLVRHFKLQRRYRKMMIIQVTTGFVFLQTFFLQFGAGFSTIPDRKSVVKGKSVSGR